MKSSVELMRRERRAWQLLDLALNRRGVVPSRSKESAVANDHRLSGNLDRHAASIAPEGGRVLPATATCNSD
jgi:hypothetical protein